MQLVLEFLGRGVVPLRHIGRHHMDISHPCGDEARALVTARPIETIAHIRKRLPAEDRDAIVRFLAPEHGMITGTLDIGAREVGIRHLRFLNAEHVGFVFIQPAQNNRHTRPDGVDVETRDFHNDMMRMDLQFVQAELSVPRLTR